MVAWYDIHVYFLHEISMCVWFLFAELDIPDFQFELCCIRILSTLHNLTDWQQLVYCVATAELWWYAATKYCWLGFSLYTSMEWEGIHNNTLPSNYCWVWIFLSSYQWLIDMIYRGVCLVQKWYPAWFCEFNSLFHQGLMYAIVQ